MDCFAASTHCLWAAVSDSRSLLCMLMFDTCIRLYICFKQFLKFKYTTHSTTIYINLLNMRCRFVQNLYCFLDLTSMETTWAACSHDGRHHHRSPLTDFSNFQWGQVSSFKIFESFSTLKHINIRTCILYYQYALYVYEIYVYCIYHI